MPCEKCKDSYLDSYNVSVDTLKRDNPTLSVHEVKVRAALQFRPIFHAMEIASGIENAGKEEYKNGEFTFTPSGEMYFLNTGSTAEQLHINQRRSSELKNNPAEYSVVDHQTSRLIQYAFVHGATVVRTSFARDGQDNRDVLEYRYDKLTNHGVIKVINTAKNSVQHDFDSIREITRQRSAHLTEVAPSEKVFIFTDVHLQQDNARSAVRVGEHKSDQYTVQLPQKDNFEGHVTKISDRASIRTCGILTQAVSTTDYAIRGVMKDTHETIKNVSLFIKNKNAQHEAKDRILDLPVVRIVRRLFEKDSVDGNRSGGQTERLTLERIGEKQVRIVEIIKKQHEEMKKGMAMLGVIAETGVAAHAAPVILSRLKEKLPTPVVAMKKSIERHAKKELRKKKKELRKTKREKRETKKDSAKVQPLRSERVEPLQETKERKRRKKRSKEDGIPPRRPAGELLTPIVTEKRRLRRIVEKSVRRHKKELRRIVKRETKKDSVKVQPLRSERVSERVEPLKERKRSTKKNERAAVAGMWFAWMVRMMLNRANFPPVGSKLAMIDSERRGAKLIHPPGEQIQTWVLLSIIWYLTAIREQGMQSNPTNPTNTTNNQMKINQDIFPEWGIIFAYNS